MLVAHGWSPYTAGPLATELEQQARGGWLTVAEWLDALDEVPSLAVRRAGRDR